MPSLGRISEAVGAPFRLLRGGTVKGVLSEPPALGNTTDPRISAKRVLTCDWRSALRAGDLLTDMSGGSFWLGYGRPIKPSEQSWLDAGCCSR